MAIVLVVISDDGDNNTSTLAFCDLPSWPSTMDASRETGTALIIGPHGEVKCVGNNEFGQCGLNSTQYMRLGIGTVDTMNGFPATDLQGHSAKEVAMSKEFSAVLLDDGSVTTFGNVPDWAPSSLSEVDSVCAGSHVMGVVAWFEKVLQVYSDQRTIEPIGGVRQVSCGYDHVLALDVNGDAWLLGSGATTFSKIEAFAAGTVAFVAAGWENSGIIDTDGAVHTWGKNNFGQLGHHFNDTALLGDDTDVSSCSTGDCSVELLPNTRATYLSMGKSHSVVTLCDGNVVGFGLDAHAEATGYMPSQCFTAIIRVVSDVS